MKRLIDIVHRHKTGNTPGIFAVCSAHPLVLEASLRFARDRRQPLLVEATSNQVDQYGGYTGMTPAGFVEFIWRQADTQRFPREQLLLGGDHLGPNRWQHESAQHAMQKAELLIEEYVLAGFKKIHLDCSMACADDTQPLSDAVVAQRAARLAAVAENAHRRCRDSGDLVYVIGTEVPAPGGAKETSHPLSVTTPQSAQATLDAHRLAFEQADMGNIWPRVIGLVVQPGVEFTPTQVMDYQPEHTRTLSLLAETHDMPVFEAHSTDYQTPSALRQLVCNHFAILKVGPALTFALREALFALANMEQILCSPTTLSGLRDVLEETMLATPKHWHHHCQGNERARYVARHYSYADRVRYYWTDRALDRAVHRLLVNLEKTSLPLPLLSQYLPHQYARVRAGMLSPTPHALIIDHIQDVLRPYHAACQDDMSIRHT